MTNDDIRAAITSSPELQALVPDTTALAAALSVGRVKYIPTEIGVGTIIESLGLAAGNNVLDAINANADFRHIKPLIEQSRLRLDSAFVRGTLASLIGVLITQEQHDALLARAQQPDPVSEFDVRCAIFNDDGTLRV